MKRRGALALMALGILLAGGASVLVLGIARQANEASRSVIPQVYVVMAAREIPDQSQITPDALVVRPFPADFAPAGAIATPDEAVGKFAVSTIYKDQIVLQGHVSVAKRQSSLSDRVPVGKVVMWFPMPDILSGNVGFKPGDRLDILLTLPLSQTQPSTASTDNGGATSGATGGSTAPAVTAAPPKSSGMSTQTTLQNVEIFALGERVESGVTAGPTGVAAKPSNGNQPLALLLDHQDAIIVKYIKDSGGTIDLALRSADEDKIVRTDAVTVDSIAERFRFRIPQEVRP
jgi:pilus assembly protein CpaB